MRGFLYGLFAAEYELGYTFEMKNIFKRSRFCAVFGLLTLSGAGCAASSPSSTALQPSADKTFQASSSTTGQVSVVSEADFVTNVMKNSSAWSKYENKEAGVTFQYPAGFFTEAKKYGDQTSGISYWVDTKPTKPEDGICDGLADADCDIIMWPVRYKNFLAALRGSVYSYGSYEATRVAQKARIIGGTEFVTFVEQGLHGSCSLVYVRATPHAYASFVINICDDPQLNVSLWVGNKINQHEKRVAENILAGKDLSDSTRIKIQAMEKVLATLRMN